MSIFSRTPSPLPVETAFEVLKNKCRQADIDGLTGLSNYRHFQEVFLDRVVRAQTQSCVLSLIRLDIDHFKQINERFGHTVADELLEKLGGLFGVRAGSDLVARVGGEEFAVILWAAGLAGARRKAEALRRTMETKLSVWLETRTQCADAKVTASFGVATLDGANDPGDPFSAASALHERADRLQRLAKLRGRNRVEWDISTVTPAEKQALAFDLKPATRYPSGQEYRTRSNPFLPLSPSLYETPNPWFAAHWSRNGSLYTKWLVCLVFLVTFLGPCTTGNDRPDKTPTYRYVEGEPFHPMAPPDVKFGMPPPPIP